jgi:hypothetical protein
MVVNSPAPVLLVEAMIGSESGRSKVKEGGIGVVAVEDPAI